MVTVEEIVEKKIIVDWAIEITNRITDDYNDDTQNQKLVPHMAEK